MKRFYLGFFILFVIGVSSNPLALAESHKIKVGEKLKFSVRWLGLEVGQAEAVVLGIEEINGRKAYHIIAKAKSNSLIDIVYPVRDEHHTYMDVERLHSLRYEKIIQEGRYRADEVIEFDQENHKALYYSRKNKSKKRSLISKDVQDELSSAYWFRLQPLKAGETVHIPANADEKNWDLTVKILKKEKVDLGKLGTFEAFELEPSARFQGIFIRRGKIRGWISDDDKRLPLMMKTKIPVLGTITVKLVSYEG